VIDDGWHMPVGLVVTARATSKVDVAIDAGFAELYGPQIDWRKRAVMFTASYRSR
jgi:hypothetical protein